MTTLLHSEQTLEALSGNDASWCRDVRRNDVITGEVSHKREKSDESMMSVENESPKHLLRLDLSLCICHYKANSKIQMFFQL